MPTFSASIQDTIEIASGAQSVTISFKAGEGEWWEKDGVSSAAYGHHLGEAPVHLNLATGSTIEVRGRGVLVVTADTVSSAFQALVAAQ